MLRYDLGYASDLHGTENDFFLSKAGYCEYLKPAVEH